MSMDSSEFLERVNDFLKERVDRRFAQAPAAEQVEHHLAQCEEMCRILDQFVTTFVYELSWLEENDERHGSLDEKGKTRLKYLQKRCENLADLLSVGTEDDDDEDDEAAPPAGGPQQEE
jgi:hypothetical protein